MKTSDAMIIIEWMLMIWCIVINVTFFTVSCSGFALVSTFNSIEANTAIIILCFSGMMLSFILTAGEIEWEFFRLNCAALKSRILKSLLYLFAGVTMAVLGTNDRLSAFVVGILLLVTCTLQVMIIILINKCPAVPMSLTMQPSPKLDVASSPTMESPVYAYGGERKFDFETKYQEETI